MAVAEAVVVVETKARVESQIAERDCVLRVGGLLLNVRVAVEGELMSAARQVEREEAGQEAFAFGVVEVRVGDGELEILRQERVLELNAELCVVATADVCDVGAHARVVQSALLAEGERLVGERVRAGKILDE